MTTDSYHIDMQYQGVVRRSVGRRSASPLPLLVWAEAQPDSILPLGVRLMQRITGASASTARLYAELAGFSITGERRDA